jgi:hypothetical protein
VLHRYVSDLETDDVFEPVVYVLSPFVIREYCHGVDEMFEGFHAPSADTGGAQMAIPTLTHIEKIRLLKKNCPDGPGPHARIHFEYDATHHAAIPAGTEIVASGRVVSRYLKRGRAYLDIEIEVRSSSTGELFTTYRDTSVLTYEQAAGVTDATADV